ncbi:MAG TPA: hypothetical protein VFL69_08870 [Marmoricola sp.]|nr:hypothetical protein [Marmoricola sp.]
MSDASEAIRRALLEMLLGRVEGDRYPSYTMLDTIETLIRTPEEARRYARLLLRDIERSPYPSFTTIGRVQALI